MTLKLAILGAGQIALRTLPLLNDTEVRASTRTVERFSDIEAAGAQPCLADLNDLKSLIALCQGQDLLLFSVAPGRGAERASVYGPGLDRCLKAMRETGLERMILITSTAVYDGYQSGEVIDEDSPTQAITERSRVLVEAEDKARAALGAGLQVLRPAGLYRRGRGPFHFVHKALAQGHALTGSGQRILNLVHDHDVARNLAALISKPERQLLLLADGQGQSRAQCYGQYAQYAGLPAPTFEEPGGPLHGAHIAPKDMLETLEFPSLEAAIAAGEL